MAHVRQRQSGKWETRYRGPDGRERSKTFRTKAEAEHHKILVEADRLRGTWVDPRLSRITVREWALEVEGARVNRRASTRARDEASLRTHILPRFGDLQLRSVDPHQIRSWVADLEARGLAPATIHKTYQILCRILASAVIEGRLAKSPCRGIALPKIEPSEKRFLNSNEVNRLIEAMDVRFRTLVLAAAYTGMRFGELAALRIQSFDPLRKQVRVEGTATEVSGEIIFGPPKTAASRRTLSIPRFLSETMISHIKVFPDPSDLIFTSPTGSPLRRSNFRRRFWLPAVGKSVGFPCTFHDLRHTHAALLIAQGEHPKIIQERLGHGSIKVTLDIYGHLMDGLDEAAATALDTLYRESLSTRLTEPTEMPLRMSRTRVRLRIRSAQRRSSSIRSTAFKSKTYCHTLRFEICPR